ncbi:hypothetical protein GOBAR_AA05346 [Gossypium barbadense]|uniref:Uncharacterized protein n=1 Tax=Gossypium barbadense TaxID=3634 RepID=A0A2P5YI16_GOSBA|nr:hypothetical protein GOBAR_AA05346 [Gossypium barbadense]
MWAHFLQGMHQRCNSSPGKMPNLQEKSDLKEIDFRLLVVVDSPYIARSAKVCEPIGLGCLPVLLVKNLFLIVCLRMILRKRSLEACELPINSSTTKSTNIATTQLGGTIFINMTTFKPVVAVNSRTGWGHGDASMALPLTSALVNFLRGVPALGVPRNGNRPPQHGPPCPSHGVGLRKGSGKPNKGRPHRPRRPWGL